MSFFSPFNFLFLLGTVPIVIMYLLKKRHQELEVSSTYLWQKAVADVEANTPWQRLRKNILLILQLLAFIMLVLFLAKPYLMSDTFDADNLIVVLDNSLSMSTMEDNRTRFEEAKKEIEDLIKNLKSGTSLTLISMGNSPDVVVNKSKDKSVLIDKLKELKVKNEADNPEDALSIIKAMTKNMESYRVIFYTDKNIDMDNIILKNMGSPHDNLAIENLSCKKIKEKIRVLISIQNYGDSDVKTDLIIYSGNEIYDVQEIALKANENKQIYVEDIPNTNIVKAELDIDDALKADNVRYSVVNSSKIRRVLMTTTGNVFLEKAIALNQNLELYKTNEMLQDVKGYDLYVYDGMFPVSLPKDGNIFLLNPITLDKIVEVKGIMKEGKLSSKEDEILRYVDLDISMSKVKSIIEPSWAKAFLFSNDEAIAFKGEKENQRFVVLGFDIHDTDFPLKYSFPIFIQNVLDYTLSFNMQRNTSVLSGEAIDINVSPKASEVYIETPSKEEEKIGPPFPIAAFKGTDEAGVYTVNQIIDGKTNKNYFVSNVNTIKESNISQEYGTDNEINISENVKEKAMKNLKNIFLVFALLLLAVEWVVYNRGY